MFVQKVHDEAELCKAVEAIFAAGKSHALIEECIRGIELTVGVIGNKKPRALPPSMALATAGVLSIEEKFLPGAGENQTPAPLPPDVILMVQKHMEEAYRVLGCKGYVRIDCFYQPVELSPTGTERVIILEVNTLPGMTPATCIFHQAAEVGLRPMDFVDLIVQLGLEEHAPQLLMKKPDTLIEALSWRPANVDVANKQV
jgi:D-alanine-D-alanine ligase